MRRTLLRVSFPVLERVWIAAMRVMRAKTVGVRAIVVDGEGRFLLVRHTYRPGWHTPGGGVNVGETPEAALRRELREECGLEAVGRPELFGAYLNRHKGLSDYPILYVVRDYEGEARPADRTEIAEVGWFAPDALPEGTTPRTLERIAEYLEGRQPSEHW